MDIAEISKQLEHTGYIVLAKPLVDKLLADLFKRCHDDDPTRFHAAQVGRGVAKKQISSIRSDVIDWLNPTDSTDQAYLACMEELRLRLNASLYLGLFDYECHYAKLSYPRQSRGFISISPSKGQKRDAPKGAGSHA